MVLGEQEGQGEEMVGGELLSPGFRQPGKRSSGLGTQV